MQTVSTDFQTFSTSQTRLVTYLAEIDWNLDDTYTDESAYVRDLEISRTADEPLFGVYSAQADITLINVTGRYTPTSDDDYKSSIPSKFSFGFDDEDKLQVFKGFSDIPYADISEYKIHFNDEIKKLNDFSLSHSTVYQNIRTDLYIYEVLKSYWSSLYDYPYVQILNLNAYDENGTWTNGANCSNITTDTTTYKYSTGSVEFDIADASDPFSFNMYVSMSSAVDISDLYATSVFRMWIYLPNVTNLTNFTLRIGSDSSNYYAITVTSDFSGNDFSVGWNLLEFDYADASTTGNPDEENIDYVYFGGTGSGALAMTDIYISDLVCMSNQIPAYYHDNGLQTITLANFAQNKALFEIKTACEAEGGRFYINERGQYIFENRQHYTINIAHKGSVFGATFDNLFEMFYPADESKLINKVIFKINKLVEQSSQDIWFYPQTPKEIGASETLTVWASLVDPCVTITTPASTTDYTANTQSDGGGTDKTAQISIVTTKFATAVKLKITNNDAGIVYLTLMKLRGQPYQSEGEEEFIVEDTTSQSNFGVKTLEISNKYLDNTDDADAIGDQILAIYSSPLSIIKIRNRAMPQLQIGDIIGITDAQSGLSYIQRIIGIKEKLISGEFNQEILTRKVPSTELATYWQLDVSALGTIAEGGDGHILSP